MQLENEPTGGDEALVIRTAVCALAVEQLLVPPAAGLNIGDAD
jgi:hypothetical protein